MTTLGTPIDLAELPPLQLVTVDLAAEKVSLLAGMTARFQANGIDYDVGSIEGDTDVVLAEEFAFRKGLILAAINDAGKRLTLASSYGAALDHIAATYYADIGVARQPAPGVTSPRPFGQYPGDWESDDRFRRRIQLAPDARTPGTLRGYEYWALTAAPALVDARAFNYSSGLCSPGQIVVVVLGADPDPTATAAQIALQEPAQLLLAQNLLLNRNTRLGTDEVAVRGARRVPVAAAATLGIGSGPDPAIVIAQATAGLQSYAASCGGAIGALFAESGQKAAMTVGGVVYVHLAGAAADVDPGPDGVVRATIGAIGTEVVGG